MFLQWDIGSTRALEHQNTKALEDQEDQESKKNSENSEISKVSGATYISDVFFFMKIVALVK